MLVRRLQEGAGEERRRLRQLGRGRALGIPSGGRPERRTHAAAVARPPVVVVHVRDSSAAFRCVLPPDRSGLHRVWTQRGPSPRQFPYRFDRVAEAADQFAAQLGRGRYSLFLQDYSGPVDFRLAMAHPERMPSLMRRGWVRSGIPGAHFGRTVLPMSQPCTKISSFAATCQRHVGTSPRS